MVFLVANLVIVPLYAAAVGPFRRWKRPFQVLWCRAMCRAGGLKVTTIGESCRDRPILYVANHTSYLDIPVISGAVDGSFVAKAEVAGWPLFGLIAKVTRTVFVKRVGSAARAQRDVLLARLQDGENLILFAEGTSTDGTAVAPFKSSLFGIAERLPPALSVTIQPLSITYTHDVDGMPLTGERRSLYCWFGETTMAPHIWRVLGLRGCRVELRFLEPLTVGSGTNNRKQLAAASEARVAAGVALANAGMAHSLPPAAAAFAADTTLAVPVNAAASATAVAGRRSAPAGR